MITLTFKILSGLYIRNNKVEKVATWYGHSLGDVSVATSWCDLDLTLDLAVVPFNFKILFSLYLGNRKVWEINTFYGLLKVFSFFSCTCT